MDYFSYIKIYFNPNTSRHLSAGSRIERSLKKGILADEESDENK